MCLPTPPAPPNTQPFPSGNIGGRGEILPFICSGEKHRVGKREALRCLIIASQQEMGMVAPVDPQGSALLPPGKSILRMPRGASPSPCIPELALERLALLCGDPTMAFPRDTWGTGATLSVVTQEPHVPSALPRYQLQTGSEPSGAAQQTHGAHSCEPIQGNPQEACSSGPP